MHKRIQFLRRWTIISGTAAILLAVASIVFNLFSDRFVTLYRISAAHNNSIAVSTSSDTALYIADARIADVVGVSKSSDMNVMVKDGRWYFFEGNRSYSCAVSGARDRLLEENTTVSFDAGNAADYEIRTTKYRSKIVERQSQTVVCGFWRESARDLVSAVLLILIYTVLGVAGILACLLYLLLRRSRRKSPESS